MQGFLTHKGLTSTMANMRIPPSITDIDSGWLTDALRAASLIEHSACKAIAGVETVGADTAFGSSLYRIHFQGSGGGPASVIVKLPVDDPVARQIQDGFGGGLREVSFYRLAASRTDPVPVRCPRAIVAEIDPDTMDYVLVLEDLNPLKPVDQLKGLNYKQACALVDQLAAFHAWAWDAPLLATLGKPFPRLDAEAYRPTLELFGRFFALTWPGICGRLGDRLAPEVRRMGEHFAELIPFFVEELSTPRTIIHGELRAENLFMDDRGSPILIDFQVAGQSCGIFDVAYVISQSAAPNIRSKHEKSLAQRYWNGLASHGVADYSWERAWTQYRVALMFGLVYPVLASTRYDTSTEQGKILLNTMVARASQAIVDHDALSLLPLLTP